MHLEQTAELRDEVCKFSLSAGKNLSMKVESNSALLIHWLEYLSSFHKTGVADALLDAVASSVREVAGGLSLGLARQALFSMRGQVDLLLAWLYFKDHGVEWAHVNETADGFKLKKDLLQYLEQHISKFGMRFGILRQTITRRELDPYRLLSAHIHAQSDSVLPAVINLKDLVQSADACFECAQVAFEVVEYLNDILLAAFTFNWAALPEPIKSAMNSRFHSPEQRRTFFA